MVWCLPWYTPYSEIIKLKSFRSLVQHYFGNIFGKLSLDQLTVNLCRGTGKVCDVTLNCDELNKYGREEKWPVKLLKGHMEDISVKIPWTKVCKDDSYFKINGLSIIVQPKNHAEPVTSVLEWIFTILSSFSKWSLSKYFLISIKPLQTFVPHTGQEENFSDIFNSSAVLRSRAGIRCGRMCFYLMKGLCWVMFMKHFKVKLENTKIRIEQVSENIRLGSILEIHIENIDYYDDIASDQTTVEDADKLKYFLNIYSEKRIRFEGVSLTTVSPPTDAKDGSVIPNSPKCRRPKTFDILKKPSSDSVVSRTETTIRDIASKAVKAISITESNRELLQSKKINPKMQYCLP